MGFVASSLVVKSSAAHAQPGMFAAGYARFFVEQPGCDDKSRYAIASCHADDDDDVSLASSVCCRRHASEHDTNNAARARRSMKPPKRVHVALRVARGIWLTDLAPWLILN